MPALATKAETQPYLSELDVATGLLSPSIDRRKGSELAAEYNAAQPFPHIALDGFMPPQILERCLKEFPSNIGSAGGAFDRDQERY